MSRRLLDEAALSAGLAGLDWVRDGGRIRKTTTHGDFAGSLAYVNAVGALAEELDHHPDVELSWDRVTLTLWTHVAGGLTDLDLELARRIDALG